MRKRDLVKSEKVEITRKEGVDKCSVSGGAKSKSQQIPVQESEKQNKKVQTRVSPGIEKIRAVFEKQEDVRMEIVEGGDKVSKVQEKRDIFEHMMKQEKERKKERVKHVAKKRLSRGRGAMRNRKVWIKVGTRGNRRGQDQLSSSFKMF